MQSTQENYGIETFVYNLASAGQTYTNFRGTEEFFSSVHVHAVAVALPATITVLVKSANDVALLERKFELTEKLPPESNFSFTLREGILHLQSRIETLPEQPHVVITSITDPTGIRTATKLCRYHRLHGRITDFAGRPFRAALCMHAYGFSDAGIGGWSDEAGNYSLILPERAYNSIFIDDETYGIKTLEAWAWNIVLDADQQLDFKVGTAEVYGLNVWPNNGGFPTYFLTFRPMMLRGDRPLPIDKADALGQPTYDIVPETLNGRTFKVVKMAPDLKPGDLTITVNGVQAEIVSVQHYLETGADGAAMDAYLVQIARQGLPQAGKQTVVVEYSAACEIDGHAFTACSQGTFQFYRDHRPGIVRA